MKLPRPKIEHNYNPPPTQRFNKLQEELRVLQQENATLRAQLSDDAIVAERHNEGTTQVTVTAASLWTQHLQLARDLQAALQVKNELEEQIKAVG